MGQTFIHVMIRCHLSDGLRVRGMKLRSVVGLAAVLGLVSACDTGVAGSAPSDADIDKQVTASVEEWKLIKSTVHDFETMAPTPINELGTLIKPLRTKLCLGGYSHSINADIAVNRLKYEAYRLGATGLTHVEIHIRPWGDNHPAEPRCLYGIVEASGLALALDKSKFPNFYSQ